MTDRNALAVLAVSLASCFAASAVPRLGDVTREKYPDADSVVVDTGDSYVVRADGTYVCESESWTKILTEKGRREESVIELGYNSRYGSARIVSVSVVDANGAERAVDVSATTNETTDNSSASANIYDPCQRKIVCTIPGVKVGETIHSKTARIVEKARVENTYADIFVMEWLSPIVNAHVTVRMPKELPLKSVSVRNPLGNVESTKTVEPDGSILYAWTATNSPQVFPEPGMPPLYTQVQNIRVSTASDWKELSRWYWNLSLPHLEKTNAAMTNRVAELPKDVSAIYKWVAQEVRYMGLTMEDTSPGYAPHDVDITFDNRYGVCRDKAALLVAMLRMAGFEAYPVLIHAGAKMDEEVPLPFFNHAIVAVRGGGGAGPLPANKDGFILMDPTDESSRDLFPSYLCNKSYLVATPEGEPLHVSQIVPAEENAVKIDSRGTLDADGSLLLSTRVDIGGVNDNVYRGAFLGRKPDERRKLVERIVRGSAPGAELLSLTIEPADLQDTTKPLKLEFASRIPEALLPGQTVSEFAPALFSPRFGVASWLLQGSTALEKRRFPLVLASTAMLDETLVVKHEGGVGAAKTLPEDAVVGGKGSAVPGYSFRRTYRATDGEIEAKRTFAVTSVEFTPAEYLELRECAKRVEASERERPFFLKDAYKDADVRYRRMSIAGTVTSPFSWTITNTVEKEILTYDGKNESSELKYSWNPLCRNVELVYATVSNRNGKVVSAGARETNVFDCDWSAAAPRYPASKELVVNLPSVEIGSVVSYQTVTTVSNSPTAFYNTYNFDVFEPTDEKTVDIDGLVDIHVRKTNPKVLRREPSQPDGRLWRDVRTVSLGDFKSLASRLAKAAEVKAVKFRESWREEEPANLADPSAEGAIAGDVRRIKAIRNWMTKHVRIAGPSLYEVPVDMQLTDPGVVLRERYATRLDYARAMAALLKGAGYEADVVFSAANADEDARLRADMLLDSPCERMFAHPLCRVKVRYGGFLGLFANETTFFIGHENEYSPLGASVYEGSDFIDPKTGEVGKVHVERGLPDSRETVYTISIRENGSADIDVEDRLFGSGVGSFRKRYSEMLPEDRSRHHQSLLGDIAQAASATSDLMTDVESYPATRSFSCHVPDYAVANGDMLTLVLPEFGSRIFPLAGTTRETPIAIESRDPASLTVKVSLPESGRFRWAEESIPQSLVVCGVPSTGRGDACDTWYFYRKDVGDDGTIVFTRSTLKRDQSSVSPIWFEYLKSIDARVSSRANKTVTVRREKR